MRNIALAHETNALPIPAGLGDVEAAAIPETYFTVWTNVFERGGLKAGETLLVHGGTSGIGTTAILLAKAFGAKVITTVGSDEKAAACRRLGADLAINYRNEDFVVATKLATDGHGAEVILDMVGGDYVARNHAAARVDGRIVQIAFLHGAKVELDLRPLMMKRLDPHRLDPAPALGRREGADRRRAARECLAAARERPLQAGDRLGLPARRSRQGACADGEFGACRQDRADDLAGRCRATS